MSSNQIKQSQLIQSIVDNIIDGETRYAFLLGAGASVSSGIPLAKDLAEIWFDELETSNPEAYANLKKELPTKGNNFSNLYSEIYFARFGEFPNDGYAAIEKIITAPSIKPSFGYTLLADILIKTSHNLILTTNFDRLAETELLTTFNHHAKLIYHQSLLPLLGHSFNKPTILKVHNDVYFHPKSSVDSIKKLLCDWQNKISDILKTYNLIVLGYGGNEKEGLAKFLKEKAENTQNRIFWCTISDNSPPDNNFCHVKIDGFDEFMLTLHDKLPADNKTLLDEIVKGIDSNAQDKIQIINQGIERIAQDKIQKIYHETTRKNNKAIESLTKFAANTWMAYQLNINHTESIEEKEVLYKAGLEKFAKSIELMGNYANFLVKTQRNYDEAEKYFKRALDLQPNEVINISRYASFLSNIREKYDEAENLYLKALRLKPKEAILNGNYALFLERKRLKYETAEKYYLIAFELEPDNATILGNYAFFLHNKRGNSDQAEKYYLKALEHDPDNTTILGNYALFLEFHHKDYKQAEKYYLKALKIDPNNANINGNFAFFLHYKRGNIDQAEKYYKKALEHDPDNTTILGNYALFLEFHHKDYKQAEKYYKKALEIEPNNANINGNYAFFLVTHHKDYKQAEIYYKKALEHDPDNATILVHYALFLETHHKDYKQAEKYYKKALEIDPANEYYNGHYAGFLLATNRKEEAIPYLEIAEKTSNQDAFKLMLLFYRLAHFPEDYAKSKSAISELLQKGVRIVGWNFDAYIERAEKDGCTYVDELRKIAKAITTEAPTIK